MTDSVPALIVVVPVWVLTPSSVSVPAPVFTRSPAPEMPPEAVTALPCVSIVPVPFVFRYIALSIVVEFVTSSVAVSKATGLAPRLLSLAMDRVPAESIVVPV